MHISLSVGNASVIPAIGFFCSGGRCVIVSMKQHAAGVAKVVNPLGTVVTVQSDDETEVEVSEDAIIHENCDEALFRPVVAPKTLIYSDTNKQTKRNITDNICTKNLKLTTEVKYKIPAESTALAGDVKTKIVAPARTKKSTKIKENIKSYVNKIDVIVSTPEQSLPVKKPVKPPPVKFSYTSDITNDPLLDSDNPKTSFDILIPEIDQIASKEDPVFETDMPDAIDDFCFTKRMDDLKKLESDIYKLPPLSDSLTRLEPFGDTLEEEKIECKKLTKKLKNEKQTMEKESVSSSEENVVEEKILTKKPRKPKSKLGVKISNVNKENEENLTKKRSETSCEITLPAPRKSWSTIAASKPKEPEISLSDIENVTIELPKKTSKTNLIEAYDEQPSEEILKDNILEPEKLYQPKVVTEEINLLKVDKFSDDEKISSSQTETTESDDSSKIPAEQVAMVTEEDNYDMVTNPSSLSTQGTKSAKKKSKKKRK